MRTAYMVLANHCAHEQCADLRHAEDGTLVRTTQAAQDVVELQPPAGFSAPYPGCEAECEKLERMTVLVFDLFSALCGNYDPTERRCPTSGELHGLSSAPMGKLPTSWSVANGHYQSHKCVRYHIAHHVYV
jgi:hypothetical protein